MNQNFKRIVSLSPATTEIIYFLGADNNLIAVSNDCNYPKGALKKEKIGKFGFINIEKLISLKPDLIIATKDMGNQLNILKKYNVPLIALENNNIQDIFNNIRYISRIFKVKDKSKILENQYKDSIKDVKKKNKKVLFLIWYEPIISVGNKTFINDIIENSGYVNITKNINSGYFKVDIEFIIKNNPDILLVPNSHFDKIDFSKLPWKYLNAVKNNKIYKVNDDIFLRPSPRVLQAIEYIKKIN
jgi:iron complex transport system substrate-binding protein